MTEEDTFEALLLRIVVDDKGTKRYYNTDNQLHRVFGPAVEFSDGSKMWISNGKLHRTDGPAAIYSNGYKEWYLNDEHLTEEEFLKHPLCTIK